MKKFKCVLPFLFAWLIYVSSQAQDNSTSVADSLLELSDEDLLKFIVTTASKSKESLESAPAIMSIITAKEIEAIRTNTTIFEEKVLSKADLENILYYG